MKPIAFRFPGQDEYRMCVSKKTYVSEAKAKEGWGPNKVYNCPYCGKWHRTNKLADGRLRDADRL